MGLARCLHYMLFELTYDMDSMLIAGSCVSMLIPVELE